MVNEAINDRDGPERALVLSYAPSRTRAGLAALLALDDRFAGIVARAREPAIGQMRLVWWFEALEALDVAPPPAEPLLRALAAEVLPAGITGAELAVMVDGWERLLGAEALDPDAFARERGGRLFALAARLLGGSDRRVEALGEGWALADLAKRHPEATAPARKRLDAAFGSPWPRLLRPLGALALLARSDLAGGRPGAPGRVGRLLWHRLTGR